MGRELARTDALPRALDAVRSIDTEIANLRAGLELGYSAPRSNVEAVVGQVSRLLEASPEDSPYYEPATRDPTEGFGPARLAIIRNEIMPAARRYRDFLQNEYLEAAREDSGVECQP